jgi:hypothetical protein
MCGGKITYDNTDSDFDIGLAIYTRLECYEPIIKREFAPNQARKPRQKMVEAVNRRTQARGSVKGDSGAALSNQHFSRVSPTPFCSFFKGIGGRVFTPNRSALSLANRQQTLLQTCFPS